MVYRGVTRMALILIICCYTQCVGRGRGVGGRAGVGGTEFVAANTNWMVFVLPIYHQHKELYLDRCKRLPYLALVISWRLGSIRLQASPPFRPFSFQWKEEQINIGKTWALLLMGTHRPPSIFHVPSAWWNHKSCSSTWTVLYWQCLSCECVCVLVASYTPMKKVSGAPSPVNSSTVPGSNLSQSPTASTNRPESWKRTLSWPNPHYDAHTCDRSLKRCSRFYYLTDGRERVRTLIAGTTLSSTFFFLQSIKIPCCSCCVLWLHWLFMLKAGFF